MVSLVALLAFRKDEMILLKMSLMGFFFVLFSLVDWEGQSAQF